MSIALAALDPITRSWVENVLTSVGQPIQQTVDFRMLQHAKYARSVEALRAGYIRAYSRRFDVLFKQAGARAAATYRSSHSAGPIVSFVNGGFKKQVTTLFEDLYVTVGKDAGRHALGSVRKASSYDIFDPLKDPLMKAWMKDVIGERITAITKSEVKKVQGLIKRAVEEGLSVDDIADELEDMFSWAGARARLVARTETIAATNAGSHFAIRENVGEDNLWKIWMSIIDPRTRDTHIDANEQRRKMDDPFDVGGYELMFPGDSSMGAGPEELCNCRCTTVYEMR